MKDQFLPFIRLAQLVAAIVAILVAVGPPGTFLYFGYVHDEAEVSGELEFKANEIGRMIHADPEFWNFKEDRIQEIISDPRGGSQRQFHRVIDADGDIVAHSPEVRPRFRWPTIVLRKTLEDFERPVGVLEIEHSMEPVYVQAIVIGVFSAIVGILVFWSLKVLPLRLMERAWNRVAFLASHDALTGLPNRSLYLDRLDHALEASRRSKKTVTVFSLDLDFFKDVNDTLGHAAGDAVLKEVAKRLSDNLRDGDTLARFGGDEFAVILLDIEKPQQTAAVAQRMIDDLSQPFQIGDNDVVIGASIGMSVATETDAPDAVALLKNADLALYRSKTNGRGTYHFFKEDMDSALLERKSIEMALRVALANGKLELHYQPLIDLKTRKALGMEALLRWTDEELGEIEPLRLIPIAETTGLMRPISEWVLNTACKDALAWDPLTVAVNLSPSMFQQSGLVDMVKAALANSGLPAHRLELELTEDVLIKETDNVLAVLRELKALGVRISMDDFGTGYSSLSYLRRFPFDKLKIDRSFISEIDTNVEAQAIVRAIIGMSEALNMSIVAEGVETDSQVDVLLAEGCGEVQGFLFGRPMPRNSLQTLLEVTGAIEKSDPGSEPDTAIQA